MATNKTKDLTPAQKGFITKLVNRNLSIEEYAKIIVELNTNNTELQKCYNELKEKFNSLSVENDNNAKACDELSKLVKNTKTILDSNNNKFKAYVTQIKGLEEKNRKTTASLHEKNYEVTNLGKIVNDKNKTIGFIEQKIDALEDINISLKKKYKTSVLISVIEAIAISFGLIVFFI